MVLKTEVWRSFYQDSVVLMRIAGALRGRPDVREAGAFMGTPANHALLDQVGLATAEGRAAGPDDLIVTVDGDDEAAATAALSAARDLLTARREVSEEAAEVLPRTLDTALRRLPDANLAAISVPGAYAKAEALRALKRGLNVFLFSDNVPVQDEVALKDEALERGLLCMGPDCGTAYLNGVGLGFYNVVEPGRVGLIAASGTGLQAVVSRLAALGEGVSQGIGVGGRDLSEEVGGKMTFFALEALAADPRTEAIVVISKPPADTLVPALEDAMAKTGKPVVVCCLGAERPTTNGVVWVGTLDQAAEQAAARLAGRSWPARAFREPGEVRARLGRVEASGGVAGRGLLGLFTGGTLAHEAHLILEPLLGPVDSNLGHPAPGSPHRLLDLGDDAYTVGRPHPMIDPETRLELLRKDARAEGLGVLLFDLVLGRGADPDPAGGLAVEYEAARVAAAAAGRRLAAVASVVGTSGDPQGLARQVSRLEAAGIEVLPSNAEAARFAALLVRPELSETLLEARS
jgi:FdrA protein